VPLGNTKEDELLQWYVITQPDGSSILSNIVAQLADQHGETPFDVSSTGKLKSI
jgi:hypothetical protein